jgi:hypothetical protein
VRKRNVVDPPHPDRKPWKKEIPADRKVWNRRKDEDEVRIE